MKTYRPTTPSRRGMTRPDYSMITKKSPEKKLLATLHKTGARNRGKISVRHRGGGAKRMYRIIQFGGPVNAKEGSVEVPAKVLAIEYDPNRSGRIALVEYKDGNRAYIVAPQGLAVDSEIVFSKKTNPNTGDRIKLKDILVGTFIYNIELKPGGGGKLARSAGTSAKVLATEGKYTTVSLPSGEVRKIFSECSANIGAVSNPQHGFEVIGSAGRMRHKGRRPHVRGSAMNPVDHPHGGGEGRAPIGLKYPKTPWGRIAIGGKTRRKKKYSNKFILQRRK
ncbi:MAG: 50S ribosomal protein L2 [Candidatus Spechtbacterales bacterium]